MQLAGIAEAGVAVLAALGGVGGWDGELGRDFVERMLRRGEAELALEEGGLGGVLVGVREAKALGGIEELLGLLDEAREVIHGCGSVVNRGGRSGPGREGDAASTTIRLPTRLGRQFDRGGRGRRTCS